VVEQDEPAFINLIPGELGDRIGALLLETDAVVVRPPVTGSAFLTASGDEADILDGWYGNSAANGRIPVVLLAHEVGLEGVLRGLDAEFVVVLSDPAYFSAYEECGVLVTLVEGEPEAVVESIAGTFGLLPAATASQPAEVLPDQSLGEQIIDPFELLSGAVPVARPVAEVAAVGGEPALTRRALFPPAAGPGVQLQRLFRRLGPPRRERDLTLAHAVVARRPLVTCVVSRKGGVGKTATAAGVAALFGEAVDGLGHTAALIDANIGNPDAWGRLEVAARASTVRDMCDRLMRGEPPATPAYADTPALAVYPEDRSSSEGYTPAQIDRIAFYLKIRHAVLVVDLPNRLPSFSSAEAAVAAAWIGLSDVVILPSTGDPAALLGVLEYLETETMVGKPAVVAYIVPKLREIRDAAEVQSLIGRIRSHGAAIVQVPDDDRATLALVRKVSITVASPDLRTAYLQVAQAVVDAAPLKGSAAC
jgi:MinD-like ATPase involved in chromosome partitioning or flagellar assembly